jgi:hypothetical protein
MVLQFYFCNGRGAVKFVASSLLCSIIVQRFWYLEPSSVRWRIRAAASNGEFCCCSSPVPFGAVEFERTWSSHGGEISEDERFLFGL